MGVKVGHTQHHQNENDNKKRKCGLELRLILAPLNHNQPVLRTFIHKNTMCIMINGLDNKSQLQEASWRM